MRLKNISLSGFKSFVDPTKIAFPSEMSGVVGPNGCGKSNIIDAVRWVMGEISAKNLRGESMADIIFNGSSSRAPSARASVELLFDNDDGRIGGEYSSYSEISVKRTVDIDGKSTYYLNNLECRRKDITDIFLGTGLGPRSYAVIEQEMATKLISSKPEELRAYIEEVAGISVYKERRKETESRIKRTKENLNRVSDLQDEIDRQLLKLKQQVKSAERYNELKDKEKKLNSLLKTFNWQQKTEAAAKLNLSIKEIELEIEKVNSNKQGIQSTIDKSKVRQDEIQLEINKTQEEFYSSGAKLSKSEQELVFLKGQRNDLIQQEANLKNEIRNFEGLHERNNNKLIELQAELKEKEPLLQKMDASISQLDGALSPIFLSKQLLLEVEELKSNLETYRRDFNNFKAKNLEETLDTVLKFDSKIKKLVEAIENQTSKQEEKFTVQKDKLLSLSSEITNLKVKIAQISSEKESYINDEENKKNQLVQVSSDISALDEPIKKLEIDIKPLLDSRSSVEDSLTEIRNEFSNLSEEIRTLERSLHESDIEIERIRKDSQDSKINRQGYLSEAEIYLKQLEKDGYDINVLLDELSANDTEENFIDEITKVEQSIERIGPINLAATEEFKIEEERKKEIVDQIEELESALKTLENAIKKIDQESKTLFKDTYDSLNIKIAELFPKLFGGGHAKLETTSDDILDTGIVFKAMPPGKKNVNVSQLSGGEKALSSIALVFSFFSLNPAPFCILDEIDAPLDDFNTSRFINMVEEMSNQVQFIFVTHNKISMEKSKHLIGVTMQEPGVSRLVTVDIDEAIKLAAV
ncbi:MAG: AAA family ATPase [Pseudomonadota bacterium]|nr:AAA family ATPase [Pseudomonadota bacterium]MEC8168872.1 AAA family ATPase [Pseudomonadota bacterium]MEC9192911.1 AAA family ATPase [Pseudomonadota bacterium]